jgi:hypothetical protein
MAKIKISQLTAKTTNLLATDLLEVSEVSGLTYVSKKITGQQIIDGIAPTFVPYTGANANVNLGEYEIKVGQLTLDTSPTGTAAVGTTRWNDSLGSTETTLKGGSVILKNGVDLVARVVNKVTPNQTLTKAGYKAVRVSGAQGQRLAVELAQANNDNNSADTIGLVTETIATNQEGFIITVGQIEQINTTGSLQGETWTDGDVLYLSPTTPGAITNVKPTGATGHIVVIGYVEYAHVNNGKIYVKIMNGWELDELHNVYINPGTLANNDALIYESSTQLWKNKTIAQALGYTPVTNARTITINGTTQDLSADRTFTISTGITVGTTAVTSGTDGRVFFQAGGVIQQDAAFFWDNTNKRLGIGATPASTVRLDVRAADGLSNPAFRVRNSNDSANIISVQGDGNILFATPTTNTITITGTGSRPGIVGTNLYVGAAAGNQISFAANEGLSGSFTHTGISTFRNSFNDDRGYSVAFGDQNSTIYFYARNGQNLYLSDTPNTAIKNWQKSFWIKNGVAVNESLTDHFALYSADIVLGNAAPHFRTENGSIIKLYQNTAVTTTQGIADALTNLGVLASSTIAPTVQSVASAATVTPTFTNDLVKITAQAVALTLAAPTGTAIDGKDLMIRIKDSGSAQTIAWTAGTGGYRAIGVTLPTTTTAGKTTYVGLIYNSDDSRWDAIGVTTEV